MPGRSIPEPVETDYKLSRIAKSISAEIAGLDANDHCVARFIEKVVEVEAQLQAEIRWLRNMIHNPQGLEEF